MNEFGMVLLAIIMCIVVTVVVFAVVDFITAGGIRKK